MHTYALLCFIVLTVQFSQPTYTSLESTGIIPVTLSLGRGTSVNDVSVTVKTSDWSAKGIKLIIFNWLLNCGADW